MRGEATTAWIGLMVALVGCGGRPPPVQAAPLPPESDESGPTIAGIELPRLPLDVTPEDPELRDGWERTRASLLMPVPQPPEGEAWEVEAWADEELVGWMRRRADAIGAAQRALEPARADDPEYSVVASALLGLSYSRFALDLRGISTPAIFEANPDRRHAFRDAMQAAAAPVWQRAADAFGSCASVAASVPAYGLATWREYCDREILRIQSLLPQTENEETEPES